MERPLFLSHRPITLATLTASSEVPSFPVTNLQDPQPSKAWRSTTIAPYVTIDFGDASAVDTLAMVVPAGVGYLNAASGWRLRGATTEAGLTSSPGYDSGIIFVWPGGVLAPDVDWKQHTAIHRLGSTQTFRWWRADLYPGGSYAYTQIGVLLLGLAIRPSIGVSKGWEYGDDPADVVVLTPYGRTLMDPRDAPRVKNLPFKDLSRADMMEPGSLGDLMRERGTTKPFLTVVDPAATTDLQQQTIYGVRVGARRVAQPYYGRFSTTLQIRELL